MLRIVKKSVLKHTRVPSKLEKQYLFQATSPTTTLTATNALTYGTTADPRNVTFSLVNADLGGETLQIRDTNYPGSNEQTNVQTSVHMQQLNKQLTVAPSRQLYSGQLYKPDETDLASYTQTGLAGQQFTASKQQ